MHPLYEKADKLSSQVIGAAIEVHRVRCSLWQHRNGTKRVERGRTSVVAGGRVDVVLERKRQGLA